MALDQDKPQESVLPEQPAEEPTPILTGDVQRKEAEDAIQEENPVLAPLALPPLVVPRRLVASMRPERIVTLKAPGQWGEIELQFWINPSDLEVQAVAKSRPMLSNFLAYFLRGWTLEYEEERDEQGKVIRPREPVPVNNDNLDELSADLIAWFGEEYRKLRLHPLVIESGPSSSGAREPHQIGGASTGSRNGSG